MCLDPFNGAMTSRREQLFYHAGLDAYFVTGQQKEEGGRRAYIDMQSAHSLSEEQNNSLRERAAPFDQSSLVNIHVDRCRQIVQMYDLLTKTSAEAPVSALSPAVREKHLPLNTGYFAKLGL